LVTCSFVFYRFDLIFYIGIRPMLCELIFFTFYCVYIPNCFVVATPNKRIDIKDFGEILLGSSPTGAPKTGLFYQMFLHFFSFKHVSALFVLFAVF